MTPGASEVPDAEESCADPEAREFWLRMVAARASFKTVAQARDELDERGWRDREAAIRLAKEADGTPGRQVRNGLGRVANRTYRQVNVKLGEPDYEALKALAVTRDLPPSTMARILVRDAIREAAGIPTR